MQRLLFFITLTFIAFNFSISPMVAQTMRDASLKEPIREFKIIEEYSEGKYDVAIVQYKQGSMRVKEKIYRPKNTKAKIGLRVNLDANAVRYEKMLIVIDKSEYTLELRYNDKPIRAYRAVFGPNPLNDKCMEGDRCTPEGSFTIANKNPGSRYHRFLLLNYPNETVLQRFKRLKAEGKIPASAKVGGDIGIHGIWQGGDDMIEMGVGWTDGCIALKNKDIEDLFSLVGVGTKVLIQK